MSHTLSVSQFGQQVPGRPGTLVRNVRLANGQQTDARFVDGLIAEIGSCSPVAGDEVLDLDGYLLLPGLVEPHTHLDKALLANQAINLTNDLAGAISAMSAYEQCADTEDIVRRATRAALLFRDAASRL